MYSLDNAQVLVIGGAGFIGSRVVRELLKEPVKEVIIYDNFTRGKIENIKEYLKDKRLKIFPDGGDILYIDLLKKAMKGVDYVFHLAALWLLHCQEYPRSAFHVNIEGTFNVMEAARDNNIKRVVYSSSASVYGDAIEIPMTEEHPYNNKTFYGATKIAGEHMFRAFYHRYGLDYVGLRYMNVYGPGQDYRGAYIAVIMRWLDLIEKNEPLILYGDGSQTYDFIYVDDVARANVLALKNGRVDNFYNIGSGKGTTLKELANLLLKITGKEYLGIKYEPQGVSYVTKRIGSSEKAKKDLHFESSISLEEGLKRLIEWRSKVVKGD